MGATATIFGVELSSHAITKARRSRDAMTSAHGKLADALANNRGLRLTADEVFELTVRDDAIGAAIVDSVMRAAGTPIER